MQHKMNLPAVVCEMHALGLGKHALMDGCRSWGREGGSKGVDKEDERH